MLASSIYHLLYYNGEILGISGIYGSAVTDVLDSVRKSITAVQEKKEDASQSPSETDVLVNNRPESTETSSKNPKAEDEQRNSKWKIAFVMGLLSGGALLRLLRGPIESRLGIPIFEQTLIQGASATPIVSILSGLLVGIGTKVCLVSNLN